MNPPTIVLLAFLRLIDDGSKSVIERKWQECKEDADQDQAANIVVGHSSRPVDELHIWSLSAIVMHPDVRMAERRHNDRCP